MWATDLRLVWGGAGAALVLSLLFVVLSDRLWETPLWLRTLVAGAGWGVAAALGLYYARRWVWSKPTPETLARVVKQKHRGFGDQLLGVVELSHGRQRPADMSPALCAAAIRQVSAAAVPVDFNAAVSTERASKYARALQILAVVLLIACVLMPAAALNALARWLVPFAPIDRFTFTRIDKLPDKMVVARGEPFDLNIVLKSDSRWKPESVALTLGGQPLAENAYKGGQARFRVPGQTQPTWLVVKTGDISRTIAVEPVYRPELKQLDALVNLPDYLRRDTQKLDASRGFLTVLKGGNVTFQGETARKLLNATLKEAPDAQALPMAVKGPGFSTPLRAGEGNEDVTFDWRDEFGLGPAAAARVEVRRIDDEAPATAITSHSGGIAMLEEEVVQIESAARDDFGISKLEMTWEQATRGAPSKPGARELGTGDPKATDLRGSLSFSPKLLQIPVDTSVTMRSAAVDYKPGRAPSLSEPLRIFVVSRSTHARLIQEQVERAAASLEEVVRAQEAIVDAAKQLAKMSPEDLAGRKGEQKMADQAAEQQQNAARLEDVRKEAEKLLREALKNPEIRTSRLSEMTRQAEEMKDLASSQMPKASDQMNQGSGNPDKRQEKLAEANKQMEEIMRRLQELQNKSSQTAQDMHVDNLALRLRRLAGMETKTTDSLKEQLQRNLGLNSSQLTEQDQQANTAMADDQENARRETADIQRELQKTFDRTQLEKYSDVAGRMKRANPDTQLGMLSALLRANRVSQSMESSRDMARKYNSWAEKLSEENNNKLSKPSNGLPGQGGNKGEGGEGGEGQSREMTPEQMEAMLKLLRARAQQETVLNQTTASDQQLDKNSPHRKDMAGGLESTQGDVARDVKDVLESGLLPLPEGETGEALDAMGRAKGELAKPELGQPAQSAEREALAKLDEAIAAMMKSCSGKCSSQMMAMCRMMSKPGKPGNRPGTNPGNGGDTNAEIPPGEGESTGNLAEHRSIERAGGGASKNVPEEYRDMLESYYKAVDSASAPQVPAIR
ncbi:hypothetical protein DB346_25185 [Verrucomicrobia bacterium LW23]|nr:hypothetical protein DB346_25185 [Verrucomicrobia bacterium LW23]